MRDKEDKVVVLFTCYNRKNKTLNAIQKLQNQYKNIEFVIVDDKSTDGTVDEIEQIQHLNKKIIETTGNQYYSGSMRIGMNYILTHNNNYDYILLINDDVDFNNNFLISMIAKSKELESVLVGATQDNNGKLSYGGIKYTITKRSIDYERVGPEYSFELDTFNANCVLIPYEWFVKCGPIDKHYTHSLGDFDYGFALKSNNFKIRMFDQYVGICNRNDKKGTWLDRELPLFERLRKKEHPKGAPTREVYYYHKKNFTRYIALKVTILLIVKLFLRKI